MDILNKAGETITNKGKYVAKKAKDLAEIASLHTQITIQEYNVNRSFQELGKLYYEQVHAGASDDIAQKCGEIDAAVAEIERLKKTVMTLKGIRICPNCGAKITDQDAIFCSICAAKLPEDEEESPEVVQDDDPANAETAEEEHDM
ncbi:MAG: zinc ribbon domain-containing protein [Clostridium sp.]|jgi:hypothetical protein|nr:zinc ribbon domain-containing protein [Clostridium sp.]